MKKEPRMLRLIIANTLKKSGTASMFIFFNIFIWKELGDFQALIGFNLMYACVHTVFFLLFSGILKNGYRGIALIISMFLCSGLFAVLAFYQIWVLENLYLMGGLLGFANAIYWITFNNNNFDLTTFFNRGYYSGLRGSINTIGALITPVVIGGIISYDYLGYGYETAFLIGASMFLFAGIIGNVPLDYKHQKKYKFLGVTKKMLSNKKVLLVNIFYFLGSFAFSTILLETLLPFLMYIQVDEEYKLGFLVSLFAGGNIVISYIIGKYIQYTSYKVLLRFVGISYALIMVLMILYPNFIVLFSALLGFLFIIYAVPMRVIISNTFHEIKGYKKVVSEQIAFQELFVMGGRITALSALFYVGDFTGTALHILFGVMILCILATTFYYSSVDIANKPCHKEN